MASCYRDQMNCMKALAERLAPGRKVKRITLDFSSRSVATAVVEVLMEQDDVKLVEQCIDDCKPDITIVETP